MQTSKLGSPGLEVSRLCQGCSRCRPPAAPRPAPRPRGSRPTPIVGARKLPQLDDAVAAFGLTLTQDDIAALQAPYVPHAVAGFS